MEAIAILRSMCKSVTLFGFGAAGNDAEGNEAGSMVQGVSIPLSHCYACLDFFLLIN